MIKSINIGLQQWQASHISCYIFSQKNHTVNCKSISQQRNVKLTFSVSLCLLHSSSHNTS